MTAAVPRIVHQEDVARPGRRLERGGDRLGGVRHGADIHREVVGLRDEAAACVAQRDGEIARGVQDLRVGGAQQSFAHLLDDRREAGLQDGERDGIRHQAAIYA